jgi:hypothetical protein
MTDAEVAKYKSLMEEDFRKNQLKPGDEGYEYDKQVQCQCVTALHTQWAAGMPTDMRLLRMACDICCRLNSSPQLKITSGMRATTIFER